MDYRNESEITIDIRWNDRITYDGTWENNLFNFFTKVTPKLTEDLKKTLEDIYRGGNSKSRNPHMQTILRMVGFGDNAGSGFPTILNTWKNEGWVKPELIEDTNLNQVTLVMKMEERENENVIENVIDISEEQIKRRLPEYSRKKVAKAYEIVRMISENPKISIKEKC